MNIEEQLNAIERSNSCWDWAIDGLAIWPILKVAIISRSSELVIYDTWKAKLFYWAWRSSLALPQVSSYFRNDPKSDFPDLPQGSNLYFSGIGMTRLVGDRYLLQTCAGLWLSAKANGSSCVQWLGNCGENHPAVQKNWCPKTFGVGAVLQSARAIAGRQNYVDLPQDCQSVVDLCAQSCGLTKRQARTWLCQLIGSCLTLRDKAIIHFKKNAPSRVILTAGGYWDTAAFAAAARACAIETVEVQHGVLRPGADSEFLLHPSKPNTLADVFYGYSPLTNPGKASELQRYVAGRPGTLALMEPEHLEPELKRAITDQTKLLDDAMERSRGTCHIFVSHQTFDSLAWLDPVIDELGSGFQIWIKLRNRDSVTELKCKALEQSNVDWEVATSINLGVILPHMHLHITQYSAAALEASCCGVPTYTIHKTADSLYNAQMNSLIKPVAIDQLAEEILKLSHQNKNEYRKLDMPTNQQGWEEITEAFRYVHEKKL